MPDLVTYRPGGARVVAYVVAVIMLVITAVIGIALPSDITFTPAEDVTLWLLILVVLAILHGVGRSYVRASDEGVEVLNGYRRHVVPWSQVKGFGTSSGAPWPTMVLADDERVMLFAIQSSDGSSARRALEQLRGRLR